MNAPDDWTLIGQARDLAGKYRRNAGTRAEGAALLPPLADALERRLLQQGSASPALPDRVAQAVTDETIARVLAEVRDGAELGLSRLPPVVRKLQGRGLSLPEIHGALLAADARGVLSLRPEAGGEFMEAGDEALVPPGPRGTVFTFAAIPEKGRR